MIRKGAVITNNITGERITWLEAAADTGGGYSKASVLVKPGGFLSVRHIHPQQDETFKVQKGTMRVEEEGNTFLLTAGSDAHTIKKGQKHQWWNNSESEEVEFTMTISPALNFETFLEQYAGLCNNGKNQPNGDFKFLQAMAMLNEYDLILAGPPIGVQRAMGYVFGAVGRLFGYKKYYPEYSR